MTTPNPNPTRRTQNLIGIIAITLLIVSYIAEFFGLIPFIVWLIIAAAIFIVANIALRQVRKRQEQQL